MNQFGNKKELHKTIYNIYMEYVNNKIDLDAQYQRGKVWINKDKEAFIDSILMDILPSPVIMNNDNSIGKYICIDGKQRISTIVDFIDNKFPIKQQETMVYYSAIPKNKNVQQEPSRIFDQREKNIFDSRCILIVMYDDLDLKSQVSVFFRINHGAKLSEDEIMNIIVAHNPKIADIIHDKQILTLLNQHTGKNDNENFLLKIIYMIANKNKEPFKIPRKIGALNDFYSELDKNSIQEFGDQILKILTNDTFGLLKYHNNNVLLAGTYFLKHYNYFDRQDLMAKLTNDLSPDHPENVSSDNLHKVFTELCDLDKKHKNASSDDNSMKQKKQVKVIKKLKTKQNKKIVTSTKISNAIKKQNIIDEDEVEESEIIDPDPSDNDPSDNDSVPIKTKILKKH